MGFLELEQLLGVWPHKVPGADRYRVRDHRDQQIGLGAPRERPQEGAELLWVNDIRHCR